MEKPILLFLCVANSSRSQMAEALARMMVPPDWEVCSAGSMPTQLNHHARAVMEELDADMSGHDAKTIEAIDTYRVDTVITLCAEEVCPVFPGMARQLHWPHRDPAAATGSDDQVRGIFRQVRDEIREKITNWLEDQAAGKA